MPVNHQYSAGTETYSGASEVVYTPTWISGVGSHPNHAEIKVIRRGSLVTIAGFLVVASAIPGNVVLTNLPVEFRPVTTFSLYGKSNPNNRDIIFDVNANGDFSNNTDSLLDYFFINQTYWV